MPTLELMANRLLAVRHKANTLAYLKWFGRYPNYWSPRAFSEKVQWRKLFDRNPLLAVFSDKLSARDYALTKAPTIRAPELLWCGSDPHAIPFDTLEPPFVVKPNNRSGAIVLVPDEARFDREGIKAKAMDWLARRPYGRRQREWGYRSVATRILIEEFLSAPGTLLSAPDFKLHVFDGKVRLILYVPKAAVGDPHATALYTPDWRRLPFKQFRAGSVSNYTAEGERPARLDEMIAAAEAIGAEIDYVRVDLYLIDDDIVFGELTPYHISGYSTYVHRDAACRPYPPRDIDDWVGEMWPLPSIPAWRRLYRGLIG